MCDVAVQGAHSGEEGGGREARAGGGGGEETARGAGGGDRRPVHPWPAGLGGQSDSINGRGYLDSCRVLIHARSAECKENSFLSPGRVNSRYPT